MNIFVVLILMLFAHIIDDYYLQGVLASMKQKEWWKKITQDKKYRYDYVAALICHALSWAIMITLPILYASAWNPHWVIYLMLGVNLAIHAIVDDLKSNKKKINLVEDQSLHFVQLFITWCIWAFIT